MIILLSSERVSHKLSGIRLYSPQSEDPGSMNLIAMPPPCTLCVVQNPEIKQF